MIFFSIQNVFSDIYEISKKFHKALKIIFKLFILNYLNINIKSKD
jgi:hypothetical protein